MQGPSPSWYGRTPQPGMHQTKFLLPTSLEASPRVSRAPSRENSKGFSSRENSRLGPDQALGSRENSMQGPDQARLDMLAIPSHTVLAQTEQSLQGFIEKELQHVKEELLCELAKMKAESSATMTSMQNFFVGRDFQAEETLKKLFDERLKMNMVDDVGQSSALPSLKAKNDSDEAFAQKLSRSTQESGCSRPAVRFSEDETKSSVYLSKSSASELRRAKSREEFEDLRKAEQDDLSQDEWVASELRRAKSREEFKDLRKAEQDDLPQDELHHSQSKDEWVDLRRASLELEDEHNWYKHITDRRHFLIHFEGSVWHHVFELLGYLDVLPTHMPNSSAAKVTIHPLFVGCQALLILANTLVMGAEINKSMKIALDRSGESIPKYVHYLEMAFNCMFALEVGFRMMALRTWFWVAPREWGWNFFDVFVVFSSIITEVTQGVNLQIFRAVRIIRASRALRMVRLLRFFREVRKVLFAIVGCFISLMWCMIFLFLITFMFSIFLLQGLALHLDELENQPIDVRTYYRTKILESFSSLEHSMFSLIAGFTGGQDWLPLTEPLHSAGVVYSFSFLCYMLFVIVGVMNVLTGVFLSNADEIADHSLIVQNEMAKVENFVEHMLAIFKQIDKEHTGFLDRETFHNALQDKHVQAYLSAHGLEPIHARLIFILLDEKCDGKINLLDFVHGMLKLKGEAKAIDLRIVQRKIDLLPDLLASSVDVTSV